MRDGSDRPGDRAHRAAGAPVRAGRHGRAGSRRLAGRDRVRSGHDRRPCPTASPAPAAAALGAANRVTLTRATLVGGVDGPGRRRARPAGSAYAAMVGLAVVALVLDGVDGWVARRTGTVSALGARFDMEVDAFLILVLSVYVAGSVGPWVLAIGAARYAAWAAGAAGAVAGRPVAAALLAQARGGDPGHRAHGGRGRPAAWRRDATRRSRWRWSCSPSPSAAMWCGSGASAASRAPARVETACLVVAVGE